MSFGKACIAPKLNFFNDILDDEGSFLYDQNQLDGLLQAMEKAIEKKMTFLKWVSIIWN
jgi:hypothetical protein